MQKPPLRAQRCSLSKSIFDRLAEVEEAPKRSKPNSSAYVRYGRVRFALEVKMSCEASTMIFTSYIENPPFNEYFILTVWGFFDALNRCVRSGGFFCHLQLKRYLVRLR